MRRLLIASAVAIAACAVSVPAVAGLANNPSFSHKLPVVVPTQARLVHFDDHGGLTTVRRGNDDAARTGVPSQATKSQDESEPGHGGTSAEPGDDRGTAAQPSAAAGTEPGHDDGGTHSPGGDGGKATSPGQDHGGSGGPGGK